MGSRKLDRMGLDKFVVERLSARGIMTAKDLVEMSPFAIVVFLDISLDEAKKIVSIVCAKIANKNQTALELLNAREVQCNNLPTGIRNLDTVMRGGLNIGSISEICGPPGVGKTQFCIGCCVQAVVRGHILQLDRAHSASNSSLNSNSNNGTPLNSRYPLTSNDGSTASLIYNSAYPPPALTSGDTSAISSVERARNGVIYIDTELKFDSLRLIEVAAKQFPDLYNPDCSADAPKNIESFLKCVKPKSCKELLDLVEELQPLIIEDRVTLIVLDSIAALARKEGLNEQDKEHFVIGQAAKLKRLGELCKCSVLVTNQISMSNFNGNNSDRNDPLGDRIRDIGGDYRPTLGPAWHHCVSTRLVMHVTRGGDGSNGDRGGVKVVSLVKSPIAGHTQLPFEIREEGIVCVEAN